MKPKYLLVVLLAVAASMAVAPAAQADHRRMPVITPIVGVIPDPAALLLPAIQAAREAARRAGLVFLPPNPCFERRVCS